MDENTRDVFMVAIPLASALGTAYIAVLAQRAKTKLDAVANNVQRVEEATNGHTELLLAATRQAAHSAGKEEERIERRAREANTEESGPSVPKSPDNPAP